MTNLKITQIKGAIPINCITGVEFEAVVEDMDTLRATADAASITIKVNAEGKISVTLNGTDEIQMEAKF